MTFFSNLFSTLGLCYVPSFRTFSIYICVNQTIAENVIRNIFKFLYILLKLILLILPIDQNY